MFHFFSKKRFLVDLLEGFVDMHNHLLPGIDDGSKNVTESISLIKGFQEFGVKHFIATPHIMHNYHPNTAATIGDALTELKNELLSENLMDVAITAAAEHMVDANFETLLEENGVMPIKKNYILIEMSYLQPSINFDVAVQKIASKRLFPILAHPERYVYLKMGSSKFKRYKQQGLLFQLNLLSLGEHYGKDVQKKAFKLVEEGLIDFVASDVHHMGHLNSLKEIKVTYKMAENLLPLIEKTIYNFY